MNELYTLIQNIAEIQSFSRFEYTMYPFIDDYVKRYIRNNHRIIKLNDYSLILYIEGNCKASPIALCSHLDKINHFGDLDDDVKLPFTQNSEKIIGQLDNSVGVAYCLNIVRELQYVPNMPSIYLLLSSQEECGMGGAISISEYLISNLISNISCFITIDVCPKFGYGHGMALYTSNYDPYFLISSWVKNENPNVLISEGVTDYLVYANTFNKYGIPSIALEPAVANIHNIGEECWKSDIDITYNIVKKLVTNYDEEINQKRKKKGEA